MTNMHLEHHTLNQIWKNDIRACTILMGRPRFTSSTGDGHHSESESRKDTSRACLWQTAADDMYLRNAPERQAPAERTADNDAPSATRSVANPRRKPCQEARGSPTRPPMSASVCREWASEPSSSNDTLPAAARSPWVRSTSRTAPLRAHGPHAARDREQQHLRATLDGPYIFASFQMDSCTFRCEPHPGLPATRVVCLSVKGEPKAL